MLSKMKAGKMLHEGQTHGKPLTKKQRGYFGAVASGKSTKKPKRKYGSMIYA